MDANPWPFVLPWGMEERETCPLCGCRVTSWGDESRCTGCGAGVLILPHIRLAEQIEDATEITPRGDVL